MMNSLKVMVNQAQAPENYFDAEEKEKINACARFRGYPADMPYRMYNYVRASRTLLDIHMSIHDEKNVSRVKREYGGQSG